jgi:hypothetical protein
MTKKGHSAATELTEERFERARQAVAVIVADAEPGTFPWGKLDRYIATRGLGARLGARLLGYAEGYVDARESASEKGEA